MSPLIKSIPDNVIGQGAKETLQWACVVFGLRKCRSRMATVNGSVLVPYLFGLNWGDAGQKQLHSSVHALASRETP